MNNDQGVSITLIQEVESGPQSWSQFWTAILESLSESLETSALATCKYGRSSSEGEVDLHKVQKRRGHVTHQDHQPKSQGCLSARLNSYSKPTVNTPHVSPQ